MNNKLFDTPPDGIVVTLPVSFMLDLAYSDPLIKLHTSEFTERELILIGYRKVLRELNWVMKDSDNRFWIHSMGSKPTMNFEFVYFTALGSIMARGNFMSWEPGGTKSFKDGRKQTAKHWLNVCNIVNAPGYFPFKGFQGFRYTTKIF
jgi:hypothetical protein